MAKRRASARRTVSRPSGVKRGVSKRTIPKALKEKLKDIQVAKSLQGDILEDVCFNSPKTICPSRLTYVIRSDSVIKMHHPATPF